MKIKKLSYFNILIFLLFFPLIGEEYQTAPPFQWIKRIEIPSFEHNPEEIINGEYYLLSDIQVQTNPRKYYNHYAILMDNSTGLENNSQISIDFNPSYEELIIHSIQIVRKGIVIDKLESAITSVIQKENELEKLIYNGTKSFYAILSDIRVGDILEVSYTIDEKKPLFEPYSDRFYMEWAVPVKYVYRRILSDNESLVYKYNGEEIKPEKKNKDRELIWESFDVPAIYYDEYVPYWYDAHNYIEVSDYDNWKQVNDLILELYKPLQLSDEQAQYIFSLYPEINESSDKNSIIETLLHLVQEDIRYMGIEIGRGSYIPTNPYDVFIRKFGDCKDKSLLLSELLNHKGIKAYPVLVHNSAGKDLVNVLPSPYQFNHVIVKIIHNNKTFWFDPTITFQEGSLENLSEADYKYGLVLSNSTENLELIKPSFDQTKVLINETFTLPSHINEKGAYSIKTIYYNEDADYMRSYLANSPQVTVAEGLSEYMETYYNNLEITEDFQIIDDKSENTITLTEFYEIPEIWKFSKDEDNYQFVYSPYEIYNYTTLLDEMDRTMPYSLRYPITIEQIVNVVLPKEWNITESKNEIKTDHFYYSQITDYNAKNLTLSYKYEAYKDSVSADSLKEYNDNLKVIGESIDYAIYWNPEIDNSNDSISPNRKISVIAISLVVVAYIITHFIRRKKTLDQIH